MIGAMGYSVRGLYYDVKQLVSMDTTAPTVYYSSIPQSIIAIYAMTSLIPRPLSAFFTCIEKIGEPGDEAIP